VLAYPGCALVYDPRPRDHAWRVQRALDRLEGGAAPMGRCMGTLDHARLFSVLMRTICDRLRTQRRQMNSAYFRSCQDREAEELERQRRAKRVAGMAARVARHMLAYAGSVPAEAQAAKTPRRATPDRSPEAAIVESESNESNNLETPDGIEIDSGNSPQSSADESSAHETTPGSASSARSVALSA